MDALKNLIFKVNSLRNSSSKHFYSMNDFALSSDNSDYCVPGK